MIWEVDEDCDQAVNWQEFQAMYFRCNNDQAGEAGRIPTAGMGWGRSRGLAPKSCKEGQAGGAGRTPFTEGEEVLITQKGLDGNRTTPMRLEGWGLEGNERGLLPESCNKDQAGEAGRTPRGVGVLEDPWKGVLLGGPRCSEAAHLNITRQLIGMLMVIVLMVGDRVQSIAELARV